jgi:tetratricopeptide (TPR) repeat protein
MAVQTWQQVLLADPNNTEALTGLARAAEDSGDTTLANNYLERLRAISAKAPKTAQTGGAAAQPKPAPQTPKANEPAPAHAAANTAAPVSKPAPIPKPAPVAKPTPVAKPAPVAPVAKLTPAAKPAQAARPVLAPAPQPTHTAEEMAAYDALNADRLGEAESRFKAILDGDPKDARATAGMGYVRMQQGNFSGAVSYLDQAHRDDPNDLALAAALDTARFWFTINEGKLAFAQGDLTTAEKRYRAAVALRPGSAEALNGLGDTLLKAQQPGAAAPIFQLAVQSDSGDVEAWRGLFLAQQQTGQAALALSTDRRIPLAAHTQLMSDPLFLRALASAYSAAGRDDEAQALLASALNLPFPADAKGVKLDTQFQFAGILLATGHMEQAAALYRQVLAQDPVNAAAWQGLIEAEHGLGRDAEAMQSLQDMPPATNAVAMGDPGFLLVVASVDRAEKKLDAAQEMLQRAIAQQTAAGQTPSAGIELELAGLDLDRGSPQLAFPIYRQAADDHPNLPDAWAGLVAALHLLGRDEDAAATYIPAPVRAQLENNAGYLRTMASVYAALGESRKAAPYLSRAEQDFAEEGRLPPADVEIQQAWLLYNGHDYAALDRQLMALGSRSDLSEDQRRTVQTIWGNWAVRNANRDAAGGDATHALAVLNAAAKSFPGNPVVLRALADGYARAGQPQRTVDIYRSLNIAPASVADFQVAIDAALAANDKRDAERWVVRARATYPRDPQVLMLAAKVEQARGNPSRAIDDYQASLRAIPPENSTGNVPAETPAPPLPSVVEALPAPGQEQDLSVLLAPDQAASHSTGTLEQPYLPSSGNAAVVPVGPAAVVPPFMTNPSGSDTGKGRLKDYVPPQSRLDQTAPDQTAHAEAQLAVRNAVAQTLGPPLPAPAAAAIAVPNPAFSPAPEAQANSPAPDTSGATVYGPYVPYVAPKPGSTSASGVVAVQLGDNTPHPEQPHAEVTDILPTARYVPNSHLTEMTPSHPSVASAQAAEARRHSNSEQVSRPSVAPTGVDDTAPGTGTQQYAQPGAMPITSAGTVSNTGTQQYPQAGAMPGADVRQPVAQAQSSPPPLPAKPLAVVALGGPIVIDPGYPGSPSAPNTFEPSPAIDQASQEAQPSDAELAAASLVLPSGGRSAAQAPIPPRQEAENQLAVLEGSYGSWAGGTGIARYRSGVTGIDRLYDFETPVEASIALGRAARLTVIPRGVSLDSGHINAASFAAQSSPPYLGTMPASATSQPDEQIANGVGGELQLTTRNFGLSAGYTPYEFPVRNITGNLRWRLFAGHLLLFGDRVPVRDTQLSYAGLHDPGTITPTFAGNIWGGVLSTTGGLRLDLASASGRSSFYLTGDGGILRGYHVIDNEKVEGSVGASFRIHRWSGSGSLTLGASVFGMHYEFDSVGLTYGQGGYFSPNYFALASLPITLRGSAGSRFHYVISAAAGAETFQQNWEYFYPLDPALQFNFIPTSGIPCTSAQLAAHTCGEYPITTQTFASYNVNSEFSYRLGEHGYLGAFISANNTYNYNNVSGGFFFRIAFRGQHSSDDYPTGLFPVEGLRPLRIP